MNSKKFFFELIKSKNSYRLGKIHTKRGVINTPAFMPVGTLGTVKSIFTDYHFHNPEYSSITYMSDNTFFCNFKKILSTETRNSHYRTTILFHPYINDTLNDCFSKILNLIDAELNNGSKDYDKDFIRKHVEKLTS